MANLGWHEEEIELEPHERIPVPIVSDAAISTREIKGGVLVPVLLLDTSSRPDVENLIRFHAVQQTGECRSVWARLDPARKHTINLLLRFSKPAECLVILEFDIQKYGGIVDNIIQNEALYLYPARPGERFKHDPNREKILIEVPSKSFMPEWDKMLDEALQEKHKRASKKEIERFKEEWRQIGKGFMGQ